MTKLIYPDLSYKIMGVLFKVHNQIGEVRQEKHYQKALEIELRNQKITFEREKKTIFKYEGEKIGDYFVDFVIDGKVLLELKAKDFYSSKDINQVISYLKNLGLRLGILVNFRSDKLRYKRIINPDISSN